MKVISYSIMLEEPVLVTALDGDPNSAVAFDYLPGSVLRGAIIGRYMRDKGAIDAGNPTIQRLFLNGGTRYLNGYPCGENNRRVCPTPAAWHREKGQDTEIDPSIVDLSLMEEDSQRQWKSVNKPFCEVFGSENPLQVRLHDPERRMSVHTLRNREKGRSTEDFGAVFRYEALAAGQSFDAVILCDEDGDAETIGKLLDGTMHIGGSRTAGYGKVRIKNVQALDSEEWREVEAEEKLGDSSRLVVTFLSDALIRDESGMFTTSPLAVENVVREVLSGVGGIQAIPDRSFPVSTFVGGFNRKWGLPLPQSVAVKMGSVFVFDCDITDETDFNLSLKVLEWSGIGERRAEGFGRLAFNIQSCDLLLEVKKSEPPQTSYSISDGASISQAQRMVNRQMDKRVNDLIVAKANLTRIDNPPRNSQLSGLRKVIQSELMKTNPERTPITDFLNSIEQRQVSRRQFEKARIFNGPLLAWLRNQLQTTSDAWWVNTFTVDDRSSCIKQIGNITSELSDSKKFEMTLRLIDEVLARAVKDNRKKGD